MEYLAELQRRVKWKNGVNQLQEGMLVTIREDNVPPLCWRMGRILSLHPGQDEIARVATLRTVDGVIKRSFAKLCPLPIDNSDWCHLCCNFQLFGRGPSKAGGMLWSFNFIL
ncbi:hypothetical protein NQ314_012762 [Rhamnusium bicolor]|uniref:DUF5641 domain-containing protein n=1 Tax=Rhamnusium bicolor TaxID=1586634 RepID=A0AAV8X9G0_9CUCU|nr:hypothetical protein NQ314_012762 [Rhamnusium bicolor]